MNLILVVLPCLLHAMFLGGPRALHRPLARHSHTSLGVAKKLAQFPLSSALRGCPRDLFIDGMPAWMPILSHHHAYINAEYQRQLASLIAGGEAVGSVFSEDLPEANLLVMTAIKPLLKIFPDLTGEETEELAKHIQSLPSHPFDEDLYSNFLTAQSFSVFHTDRMSLEVLSPAFLHRILDGHDAYLRTWLRIKAQLDEQQCARCIEALRQARQVPKPDLFSIMSAWYDIVTFDAKYGSIQNNRQVLMFLADAEERMIPVLLALSSQSAGASKE